jgi:hypothetical protein
LQVKAVPLTREPPFFRVATCNRTCHFRLRRAVNGNRPFFRVNGVDYAVDFLLCEAVNNICKALNPPLFFLPGS